MGKSKLGFMITWDLELTMMLLGFGVPLCYIVQMEAGNSYYILLLSYVLYSYPRSGFYS